MSENRKSLEIVVLGEELEIQCLDEDLLYLEELAKFVDSVMIDISEKQHFKKSDLVIAILACLNIADSLKRETIKSKSDVETITALRDTIALRSNKLINIIDDIIE